MKTKKKWLLYLLFVLILTASFIYYLFPTDQIKNYITFHLNQTHPEINITIDRIKPAFPPGVRLYNVTIYQLNDVFLSLGQIKIVPDLLSLFRSKVIFFFNAKTCDGMIDGRGELARNTSFGGVNVDAKFSEIQITKMDGLQSLNSRKISGVLDGRLTYRVENESGENLRATLTISDCEIDLLNPFFMLESVTFNTIEADIEVKNRKLQFKQCSLQGNQMDGSIAGSVILEKPLGKSILKLVGTMRPHQTFLAKLEKDIPKNLLPKKIYSKYGLPIKFRGTIEKPSFSLN